MASSILGLIFPGSILLMGVYFIYKGASRLSASYLTGKVATRSPGKDLRGRPCVYDRLEVDYYAGGSSPWKRAYSQEQRLRFFLGKQQIDPGSTDMRLEPRIVMGLMRRSKGILEKVADRITLPAKQIKNMVPPKLARLIPGQEPPPEYFLDDETARLLQALGGFKNCIAPHAKKPLRIMERTLAPGASVCIAYTNNANCPFLLTTRNESETRNLAREKSYFTILMGLVLIVVSAAALFVSS